MKKSGLILPPPLLLAAAFNSRSGTMHWGALAYDAAGNILSSGWNGQPSPDGKELSAARELEEWLRRRAEGKSLPPETVSLILGRGNRRSLHAEGRAVLHHFLAIGNPAAVADIARVQTAAVLPNEKYFGVKKMAKDETSVWTTCRHCARLLETIGAYGEILTTRGWQSNDPAQSFLNATINRRAPLNFWDKERETAGAILRAAGRKSPPEVFETDFMVWRRLTP